jgi:two-component system alkaline phosphatase synthesis response regulator PhoP
MDKILLVEDEIAILELLRYNLEKEGYTVFCAADGKQGLALAKSHKPDLIILDLMLPLLDGYEFCKILRADKETAFMPVMILSARSDIIDKVIGLELGADDYLTKPFNPRELTARVKARLREVQRQNHHCNYSLKWQGLEVFPESYRAILDGELLNLTVKEFDLLVLFVKNPNQIFSREYLAQKIWDCSTSIETRTIDVHVSNLRSKLKRLGQVIDAVRGIGYRFNGTTKN